MNDPMGKEKKKKLLLTCMAGGLLFLLYMLIFAFSGQDGEQSGGISQFISEKCVEIFNSITGKHWSEIMMNSMAKYFEHPIRKLAHFSEYAVMGILLYILWSQWITMGKWLNFLVIGWVFLSAAADEFHQYFVPGRYSSFADVCLDTCGGAFGVLLCLLVLKIRFKPRKLHAQKK